MHLVTRYFPHASHQTILLSTDEEISGQYYEALKPWVAKEYTVANNELDESATLIDGYFTSLREPASVA
jgi:DNA sulfur modification protein DndD